MFSGNLVDGMWQKREQELSREGRNECLSHEISKQKYFMTDEIDIICMYI